MGFGRPFTPDEDEKIFKMRKQGFSWEQIGKELDRKAVNLSHHWGYLRRRKKSKPKQAKHWTQEETDLIFELRAQGKEWPEIAATVGRPTTACVARYHWLLKKHKIEVEGLEGVASRDSVSHDIKATVLPKTYWRKCHDCGKMTYNYRCDKCKEKWRIKHHVEEE